MSNFKHTTLCNFYTNEQSELVIHELENLGYRKCFHTGYSANNWLLINEPGRFNGGWSRHSHNCSIIKEKIIVDNKEAFLAIAAIRDDDKFHVGEHLIRTVDDGSDIEETGTIIKIVSYKDHYFSYEVLRLIGGSSTLKVVGESASFWKHFRKMTPEEIIEFYKNENQKMKINKDFIVKGNKYLVAAFAKQLIEEGILYSNGNAELTNIFNEQGLTTGYPHLRPSARFDSAFTLTASTTDLVFELPTDWDAALEAFRVTKKKELSFDLPYAEGVLKLKVEKDKITLGGEEPFHPSQLERILNYSTGGSPNVGGKYKALVETVSIGCKKGIKIEDLKKLQVFYNENFK